MEKLGRPGGVIRFLFVYGTLHPKLAPPCVAHAVKHLRRVGNASAPGILYDLGPYPGAVFNGGATAARIRGGVFRLPKSLSIAAQVLRDLDAYEAIDTSAPAGALFVRKPITVALRNGTPLECWAYEYNRDCDGSRVIHGGRFERAARAWSAARRRSI